MDTISLQDLNEIQKPNNTIAVTRGCQNKTCFCSGKCKEVVGYLKDGKYEPVTGGSNPNVNGFQKKDKQGGFIDFEPLTGEGKCLSNEHNPPSNIVLPAGTHTYQCPSCGKITVFKVPLVTF